MSHLSSPSAQSLLRYEISNCISFDIILKLSCHASYSLYLHEYKYRFLSHHVNVLFDSCFSSFFFQTQTHLFHFSQAMIFSEQWVLRSMILNVPLPIPANKAEMFTVFVYTDHSVPPRHYWWYKVASLTPSPCLAVKRNVPNWLNTTIDFSPSSISRQSNDTMLIRTPVVPFINKV